VLFLHASHPCIAPDTQVLDSLSLGGMLVRINEESQQRLRTLQDATNALLRDYVSVRYFTWGLPGAGLAPASPRCRHQHPRVLYDTLTYVRWGVGTGIAVMALAAATNVLDKIASVVHLYLTTGRDPERVYFRGFYQQPSNKNSPAEPDPVIAAELDEQNLGLLALCDFAGELERPTPLGELIRQRPAATHRGIVVHRMLLQEIDDRGWLDRVEAHDLHAAIMAQLTRARAAMLYLADLINLRERRQQPDEPVITMPSWLAEPEYPDEYW
jgi:hypothetical protein